MLRALFHILILTSIFALFIFLGSIYFAPQIEYEEQYIEPSYQGSELSESQMENLKKFLSQKQDISQDPFSYHAYPPSFREKIKDIIVGLSSVLSTNIFHDLFEHHKVEIWIYEQKSDTRGKMKNAKIHLYHTHELPGEEVIGVWLHELAHFLDIYVLKKSVLRDVSYFFYDISWESTKVLKSWQSQWDFVSGYAMTNKYEDFAESALYFILHNKDFSLKAESSDVLKQKYNFFSRFVFRQEEFINTDFSANEEVEPYYWDITKIEFDKKKLLQYLQK